MISEAIAQLKATQPEGFYSFLIGIHKTVQFDICVAIFVLGVAGLAGSWLVKWANDMVGESFIDYFFRSHIKRTISTICTYLGAMAGAVGTGVFFTSDAVFVGWFNVGWLALTTAFGVDMGINKGTKSVWTPEQRAAAQGIKP